MNATAIGSAPTLYRPCPGDVNDRPEHHETRRRVTRSLHSRPVTALEGDARRASPGPLLWHRNPARSGVAKSARQWRLEPPPLPVLLSFCRGAVVVRSREELINRLVVPGLAPSASGGFRAPAHRYPAIASALSTAGIRVDDGLRRARAREVRVSRPELELHQAQAMLAWRLAEHRATIVTPPGSGDVQLALAAIAARRCPTLIIVRTREALRRWADAIGAQHDGPVGRIGDGAPTLHPLTLCTVESAPRRLEQLGHRFGLVVADEAEHCAAGMGARALRMCAAPARLGLVSSLDIGAGALEPLSELIGPPACVYTPSNAQRACTPAWLRLYVKLTSGERALHDAERAAFHAVHDAFCARGSGRWRDFVRGAAHTPTGSRALAGYHAARRVVTTAAEKLALVPQLLQRHRGERCLVVAPDAAAAHDLGRRLGVPPVGDDSALVERASVLRAFQEGALRVLVATGLEQVRIRCDSATVGVLLGQRSGDEGTQLARLLAPRSGSGAAPVVYEVISRETYEDTPLTQLFGHASPADRDYQMRHSAGAGAGLAWSARRYSRWPASPASP